MTIVTDRYVIGYDKPNLVLHFGVYGRSTLIDTSITRVIDCSLMKRVSSITIQDQNIDIEGFPTVHSVFQGHRLLGGWIWNRSI